MRDLLGNFTGLFIKDENFRRNLDSYIRFLESKDGVFFKVMMQTMMSLMVDDMLSKRFTQLDEREKDVEQRAYHQIYEALLFLTSPAKWIREKTAYKMSLVPSLQDRQAAIGKSKQKGT